MAISLAASRAWLNLARNKVLEHEMASKTTAELMREWRARAVLTTADAGKRLGLSSRAIEDIEQGRRRANDELTRIALKKLISDAK